tara:strand:- start:10099 stop:10320 length:222 start_codon:yes stop_codon:yes gene_type:complete
MLISTFIIYYILSNYYTSNIEDVDKKNKFSLEYLVIAVLIGIIINLIISYIISTKDENILTDNYWDKLPDENI